MLKIIGYLLVILGVVDLVLYYFADTILIPQILVFGGMDWTTYAVMLLGWIIASAGSTE
tara:strand:+ start:11825 stop:12001 length:177 start_codon:yes stop_codon:yes gene_type:complete